MTNDYIQHGFTFRETCTILAGLRIVQAILDAEAQDDPAAMPAALRREGIIRLEMMDHFEDVEPLTSREIDELCDRIEMPPYDEDETEA